MPSVRFELTIPGSAQPQTYSLDSAATGTKLKVFDILAKIPFINFYETPLRNS
jgi:hypothetical protein